MVAPDRPPWAKRGPVVVNCSKTDCKTCEYSDKCDHKTTKAKTKRGKGVDGSILISCMPEDGAVVTEGTYDTLVDAINLVNTGIGTLFEAAEATRGMKVNGFLARKRKAGQAVPVDNTITVDVSLCREKADGDAFEVLGRLLARAVGSAGEAMKDGRDKAAACHLIVASTISLGLAAISKKQGIDEISRGDAMKPMRVACEAYIPDMTNDMILKYQQIGHDLGLKLQSPEDDDGKDDPKTD